MYRLEKSIASAITEEQRIPTPDELATELGVTVKEIQTLLQASNENFSLSTELDGESHTELGEILEQTTVPSAEEELTERSLRDELLHQLEGLTPKEQLVLTLRHGVTDYRPKSKQEIATLISRPVEEVTAMLRAAFDTICEALHVEPNELAKVLLWTSPHPHAEEIWTELGDSDLRPAIADERLDAVDELARHAAVQTQVDLLPLDQRATLKLRFGILQDEELTLRDIGEILRLSRERVRQIEARAEAKCRRVVKRK
jgi:DNA-directed RNA polymerase sigma subunit (sigma70/sigma32)